MRHTGALRNFASTLQALAERNHQVHLVFGHQDKEGDQRLLSKLTHDFPNITGGEIAKKTPWRFWLGLARAARYTVDYVRYLTPEYEGINSLKERARGKAPAPMRWFVELPMFRSRRRKPISHQRVAGRRTRHPDRSRRLRSRRARTARRPARHAARRHRLRSGRLRQGRATSWHSIGAARPQLGQPDEQGADQGAARRRSTSGTRRRRRKR